MNQTPDAEPLREGFHVVGLGASAGGLEATMELLRALPARTGMAFVVVQHLEPNYESQLPEILSRATRMPVLRTVEGVRVEPDHVYVIPPNTVMTIRDGQLHLRPRSESAKPYYPIDVFFESLAEDQGANAIAVILSGSASDGAQGIRAVKGKCGITFSQDENSAKYSSMPHSAIATGAIDFILSTSGIAKELGRINSHPLLTVPEEHLDDPLGTAEDAGELENILERLRTSTGVDFSQYKQSTIRRRLRRRMVLHHLSTLREYLNYQDLHPGEIHDLYRDILISVTSFFREPPMFDALKKTLQQYVEARPGEEPLRLWIPGCATGEEAYSLAILATEVLEAVRRAVPVQVFGTDISDSAIERARAGIYSEKAAEEVSPERLHRYFSRIDSGYRIKQQIRETCVFARHDLTTDPPFSQMDVVSCRNVFIYLSTDLQQQVLPTLHYSLKPGGLLVLGSAETVGRQSDLFGSVDNENKIYAKKAVPSRLTLGRKTGRTNEAKGASPRQRTGTVATQTAQDIEVRAARIMRDLYAPAGVLINEEMQVIHFHGQTGPYLEQVPGEAGLNLLRLARESLVYPIRRAVSAAREKKAPVHEPGVEVNSNGLVQRVKLSVLPVAEDAQFCLVLFEPETDDDGGVREKGKRSTEPTPAEVQLSFLERELADTSDYLRRVTEQHSAVTEELRAANEEVRSSNEELQSTNEELRAAKEQLQSSNEELATVNDELKHSNSELRLASNDLSNILTAATIPILMVGMDLRLRRYTPAAETLLGAVAGDIGRTVSEVQHAFDVPGLKEMLLETLQTLNARQRRAQNGNGRWYDVFVRPYRTIDDRIEGAVVTFIDVDDAVRALEKAETALKFVEGMVETIQHPLLVLDSELRVVRATNSFYKTFGVRPEDTLAHSIDDLGNGQWKVEELRRLLEHAVLRDIAFSDLEITHAFPHLGTRTMRLNARRTPGSDEGYRILLAIEDVTGRREAAEIQYRRLFESAKDGIVVLDAPTGIVLDVNPYFLELSRYPRLELLHRPLAEVAPFAEAEPMRRLVGETMELGTVRYDTVPLRMKDRQEVILEVVSNRYAVKEKSLIQVNLRDVTDKRRYEDDLRRSNLDLQQFAFAASHDLQEPLRTITSYLQLLEQHLAEKLDPQLREYVSFITGAADRMRQLVLDLLGYSQVARADMVLKPVNAEAALATVMLNLQLAIESSHARITFDSLPVVYADETQLLRLLQNLIGNAIKYRGEKSPLIHLSATEAGPEWVFAVRDNGVGISMKYAEHIFTVFKRLHGREYPGTGIGLAVCKRIVERHGGRIWVESEPGQGSTFYFSLPKIKS